MEIVMTPEPPIACTLTAAQMPARLAEIRAGICDQPTRARLAAIVAAESACCAFLEFDLEDGPAETVLTIEAPNGGEEVMHQLVEAFGGDIATMRG
jgi:hypothetical protein